MEKINKCPICDNNEFKKFLSTKDFFLTNETFSIDYCLYCGFKFLNPKPLKSEIDKYYFSDNYISHSQKSDKKLLTKIYNFIKKINIRTKYNLIKKYKSNGSILDIGCGNGFFLNYFNQKGWETLGIEPNESARNFGIENYKINIEPENFISQIKEKSFDVVTLWHVLEHVYDLKNRIIEINKILKDDGIIVIAVPNINSFDANYYKEYWGALDVPRHLYHFSKKDINNLFYQFDYEIVETKNMPFDSFYVSLLSEKYKNKKSNFLKAFYIGFISNYIYGKKNGFSSIIYIIKKKTP